MIHFYYYKRFFCKLGGLHMRYPEFIKQGDRIGFIAPSFGCGSIEPYFSRFKSALHYFEEKGYRTVTGPNVYKSDGIGKSTDAAACGDPGLHLYVHSAGRTDHRVPEIRARQGAVRQPEMGGLG